MTIHPPLLIPGDSVGSISSVVNFDEPPGSTLTYPFLILRAEWQRMLSASSAGLVLNQVGSEFRTRYVRK